MKIAKLTTLDDFVHEAKRLRALADAAATALFLYLYEAERTPSIWRDSGYTFVQLLKNTNIIEPTRYIAYKTIREGHGARVASSVGVHAVVEAGRLNDATQQLDLIDQARMWEETNGTTISQQAAKDIAKDHKQRALGYRTANKRYGTLVRDLDTANAEIDHLRSENEMLRAENQQLRDENARLKRIAGIDVPTAAPPPSPRRRRSRPAVEA